MQREKSRSKSRSRDILIEDFNVEEISVSDAVSIPFEKDSEKVKQALVGAILLAHKGIAHFTTDPVEVAGLQGLHLCSKVVPWLICQHLYGNLGLPKPHYELA